MQIGGTALTPSITSGPSVAAAVVIAAVVLLLMFASLAAAVLPLLTAGIGVGSASPRSWRWAAPLACPARLGRWP